MSLVNIWQLLCSQRIITLNVFEEMFLAKNIFLNDFKIMMFKYFQQKIPYLN